MSTTQFTLTNQQQQQQKRFCIDDAFEEETDEAIKIYCTTTNNLCCTPPPPPPPQNSGDDSNMNNRIMENSNGSRNYKLTSRDSDSLIQDYYDDNTSNDYINQYSSSSSSSSSSCLKHPKVRENWRMVLAATILLLIGIGLLTCSTIYLADTNVNGLQGYVFLIVGFICFVPGAYHVVYIYLAAKGKRGYHFHNLPLFT